ncbi:carbohydrate ABC transporter permease [Marispirochaeta aestuarii]|uniref:carbohydrate ABC transporter permease n=1 Tax=Marispirochaeta aestuarii TaxID=1963862 RepID=UPI002ABDDF15|nr:carbohydrate ABC transporter permease [Marispirochaeta aestuarii]
MEHNFRLEALIKKGIIYFLATLWLIISIYPIIFLVLNSLKSNSDFFSGNAWDFPVTWMFENYMAVIEQDFIRYTLNSLVTVGISLIILVLAGSLAGFGLSRIRFRFRNLLYLLFVGGLTIPIHITLIPVYNLTRILGIYDSLGALIGPFVAFNLPVTVFILTSFMGELPRSLEEAAYMDGATRLQVYWNIVLPISRPAVTAVVILDAVVLWNEFIFPLVLINSEKYRPLTLALWNFQGEFTAKIPLMMASLVLASLPLFTIYAIARERLIEGMVVGAVKG